MTRGTAECSARNTVESESQDRHAVCAHDVRLRRRAVHVCKSGCAFSTAPTMMLEMCMCAWVCGVWSVTVYMGGGGDISWHFNFAWEISRFKLTAKFSTQNPGFSAKFSHTSSTRCGLWRGAPHKIPGALRNFPQRSIPPCSSGAATALTSTTPGPPALPPGPWRQESRGRRDRNRGAHLRHPRVGSVCLPDTALQ